MSTLPEQFSAARQSQVEAQITFFQTYAASAVENAEKIIALNLSTARASMEKSSNAVHQLFSAQDPRDLFALTTQTQQTFDSMLAYGREFFSIVSASPAALPKQAAPAVPEQPVAPKAPKAAPLVAPEAKAQAPVPKATPAAPPAPKAKPIAKAVDKVLPKALAAVPVAAAPVAKPVAKVVPKAVAAKPAAAPVAVVAAPVAVTTLKAVEAAKPVKAAEPRQLDMLTAKPKKSSKK